VIEVTDSSLRVIRRKIMVPPLADSVVARKRVDALLTGLLDQHRLVFIYASAGAGKTTAIVQAARRMQRPLVWLDLDVTDTATGRLLTYLEAALALQVPEARNVASSALAAHLPHAEVAGLLAESIGDVPVLIVLDDAERLADAPEALEILTSFARYLPPFARLLISSRSELPFRSSVGTLPWVAAVGEEDLALTVDEAAAALAAAGREDIDPVDAVVDTGGWMTGVLFEAWEAVDHVIGLGGEADPLHGYLATEILGQLAEEDADFLISTAVLTEVTVPRAEALGLKNASARMHALAGRRLPVSWRGHGVAMRCHPRFREFLLKRLTRQGETEQRELFRAHARLLLGEGHAEEAVEEYLKAGCLEDARTIVGPVLERVIERTDFALAEQWLAALGPARPPGDIELAASELMLTLVRERFAAGVELADRLDRLGQRQQLAASSGRAAGLMAWLYLHAGRVADMDTVLAAAPPGPEVDAARYAMSVVRDESTATSGAGGTDEVAGRGWNSLGEFTGGPMDALVLRTHFDLGRLPELTAAPSSPWAVKATESWQVSSLLAAGRTEQAFEVYHRLVDTTDQSVWLSGLVGPRLMGEIGDRDEAWRLLREGRRQILATGSVMFEAYSLLIEAEFELRLNEDPAAARAILDKLACHQAGRTYAFLAEQRSMLSGLLHLRAAQPKEAALDLHRAVNGMQQGHRLLYLPPAAVYLSEAEWRCGHEDAADAYAEQARTVAARQRSNHSLLNALAEFPDVLARCLDLQCSADSGWHELGRALRLRGIQVAPAVAASVEVAEFGRIAVTVDGAEVSPGLSKSLELLAFLASHDGEVSRDALLEALFDGRRDGSSSSYLRQAVLKLRKVIPDLLVQDARHGVVRLNPQVRVLTESQRLAGLLGQAAAVPGDDKLTLLLSALRIADHGPYLPSVASIWADERRQRLDELVASARLDAAEAAFAAGRYQQAAQLAEAVARADPYREAAWRLLMRVAGTLGDWDRVIAAYRSCERALAELGTEPSPATAALLRDTRR
jgi:ATP/maltotriose-dependent transcriptional regulator MalT/DNA-binding SARP family transcriptional activator